MNPYDLSGGPDPDTLGPVRTTQMQIRDPTGEIKVRTEHHMWRDVHLTKAKTRARWTGKIIFAITGKPDEESELPSSTPLKPDITEGLRVALAGMRTQLAESQRRDPRLREIIVALRGLPKNAYHRDIAKQESRRLKARAYKYRLA